MRVFCFIDGLNLYHSLNDRQGNRRKYKWLDLRALASEFLEEGDHLHQVLYFTAHSWNVSKRKKHAEYVAALGKMGVKTILGNFKRVSRHFLRRKMGVLECSIVRGFRWLLPTYLRYMNYEEKETDVNLAVHLVDAAYRNLFEKALIISGDSDIKPALRLVRQRFPEKNITIIFPIGRKNNDLETLSHHPAHTISIDHLSRCQLPDCVYLNEKMFVERPREWR